MGVSTKITQIRMDGGYAMTRNKCKGGKINLQEIFGPTNDSFNELLREVLQEVLEQEMADALGAEKGKRSPERLDHRSGYYDRALVTRVGKLELRIPQDRQGHFSTQIFERYQRSEKALVSALAEMYIQGVSTRKVKAITEELCGHAFSPSAISAVNKSLDESLERFAKRPLEEAYPHLVLDARDEKVREDGVIRSQAVQIAIGINDEGRRQILAVELAKRESQTGWRDVLLELKSLAVRLRPMGIPEDLGSQARTRRMPQVGLRFFTSLICWRTAVSSARGTRLAPRGVRFPAPLAANVDLGSPSTWLKRP